MNIDSIELASVVPMTPAGQCSRAAASALSRALFLLSPLGVPEDPPAPDVVGAREAFREAVNQLEAALMHASGRPGHSQVEAALEEAREALIHLTRPGINPPIADVVDHAWRGGDLVRDAIAAFEGGTSQQ
jgi:hypothetical protein